MSREQTSRARTTVVTGIAVLGMPAGTAACAGEKKASSTSEDATAHAPQPQPQPQPQPSAARYDLLKNRALAVLMNGGKTGGGVDTAGTFEISGDGDGSGSLERTRKGQKITVQAVCAGTGAATLSTESGRAKDTGKSSLTFSPVSGSARTQRLACSADPVPGQLEVTAAASDLRVNVKPDRGATGSVGYVIMMQH